MSLESPSGHNVCNIPVNRQTQYALWRATLNQHFPHAEAAIRGALNEFVDQRKRDCGWTQGAEFCSSWIPGPNWEEGSGVGVYQPLFESMSILYVDERLSHKEAGYFFGLILMDVMIHRNDDWAFRRKSHQPEDDPEGLYYYPKIALAQAV
jgi:hypothetical protein